MAYEVILDTQPLEFVQRVQSSFANEVDSELTRLAASPETLGRTPPVPYPPFGHLFDGTIRFEGRRYTIQVFFVYGPNEGQISVTHINCFPNPPLRSAT